jgi:hypothetical protein
MYEPISSTKSVGISVLTDEEAEGMPRTVHPKIDPDGEIEEAQQKAKEEAQKNVPRTVAPPIDPDGLLDNQEQDTED